jgi:hypothetical protein
VGSVARPSGSARRASVFRRAVRLVTRSHADRLDRPALDLEAGRRHAPPRRRLTSKTRADIVETFGMPNRFQPICHAIKRAVMAP